MIRYFTAGCLFGALCLYLWLVSAPHPAPPTRPTKARFKQPGQGGKIIDASDLAEAV